MHRDTSLELVPDRLPTGIDVLDDLLDGGLPAGSLVLFSAEPTSQSEAFLARLTTARPTLYLTTGRAAPVVRQSLSRSGADIDRCTVVAVDDADPMPINQAYEYVEGLAADSTLVIDPVDPLEAVEPARLWAFLNGVRTRLEETGSLGVLHGLAGRSVPANRDVSAYFADVVFDLATDRKGEFVENRLYVPKVRGGHPLEEVVKIDLTDGVTIDTSRDIA